MSKLVLIFLATSVTAHMDQLTGEESVLFQLNQGSYRAPVCAPHQSCSQRTIDNNLGFLPKMNLCSCPGQQFCTEENSVDVQGYRYSFCDAVTIHPCAHNEIALVLKKIITDIRCVCPGTATLRRLLPAEKKKHMIDTNQAVSLDDALFQCVMNDF